MLASSFSWTPPSDSSSFHPPQPLLWQCLHHWCIGLPASVIPLQTRQMDWTGLCVDEGLFFYPLTIPKMKLSHSLEQAPLWDLNHLWAFAKSIIIIIIKYCCAISKTFKKGRWIHLKFLTLEWATRFFFIITLRVTESKRFVQRGCRICKLDSANSFKPLANEQLTWGRD